MDNKKNLLKFPHKSIRTFQQICFQKVLHGFYQNFFLWFIGTFLSETENLPETSFLRSSRRSTRNFTNIFFFWKSCGHCIRHSFLQVLFRKFVHEFILIFSLGDPLQNPLGIYSGIFREILVENLLQNASFFIFFRNYPEIPSEMPDISARIALEGLPKISSITPSWIPLWNCSGILLSIPAKILWKIFYRFLQKFFPAISSKNLPGISFKISSQGLLFKISHRFLQILLQNFFLQILRKLCK